MKKFLLAGLLALMAGRAAQAQAPVPNGDFETWTGTALSRRPQNWLTTDDVLAASGFPFPVGNVTRSSSPHGGTYAAQLATVNNALLGEIPAFLVLGTRFSASGTGLPGGVPYTSRPARIEFYYKLTGPAAATDSALIGIQLTRSMNGLALPVADTSMVFTTVANSYAHVSLPLHYRSGSMPDSLRIIVTSGSGSTPTVGTTLTLDDIVLTGTVASTGPVINTISPASGPVGTTVTITGTGFIAGTNVSLNGTPVTGLTLGAGGTSLTFVVPAGAAAGPVLVVAPNGVAFTTFCVQYTPTTTGASRCGTGTVTLAASGAPAGASYTYYAAATGGMPLTGGLSSSFTTPSLSASTTYYVAIGTGTGPTACEGPRTAVRATINPAPTVTVQASGATTFCTGGSVTLTARGADTYLWSSGQTTPSITVSTAGRYTVAGTTTANGCSTTSAATTVTVNVIPAQPTITQTPPGTLTSSSATGNQFYLNGTLIPGATGQAYVVTSAAQNGSYTVVTTANGCASPASAAQVVMLTATADAALAQAVQLFPNPAHQACTVQVPAVSGASTATLTLLNALGQTVRQQTLALPAAGTRAELDLRGLPTGVYLVRLQAGNSLLAKRLLVE